MLVELREMDQQAQHAIVLRGEVVGYRHKSAKAPAAFIRLMSEAEIDDIKRHLDSLGWEMPSWCCAPPEDDEPLEIGDEWWETTDNR